MCISGSIVQSLFDVYWCRHEFRSTAGHCGSVQTDVMRSPRNLWGPHHYSLNSWWVVCFSAACQISSGTVCSWQLLIYL